MKGVRIIKEDTFMVKFSIGVSTLKGKVYLFRVIISGEDYGGYPVPLGYGIL